MQAELVHQHAAKHGELAADSNNMREELKTLDGSSSMDGDALIDLTHDVDDAPMDPLFEGQSGLLIALRHMRNSILQYQMLVSQTFHIRCCFAPHRVLRRMPVSLGAHQASCASFCARYAVHV